MSRTALLLVLLLAGCGGEEVVRVAGEPSPSAGSSVPEEFREACGRPGSTVETTRLRVVVRHDDCDLTGVTISNQGRALGVPARGTGAGDSTGVDISVAENGDVTFTAEAEVAQY